MRMPRISIATIAGILCVLCALGASASALSANKKTASRHQAAAPAMPPTPDLELDTTSITGSRELPTVLNIVPWKRAPVGEVPSTTDRLLGSVLQPVDRVEFRRELRYADPAAPP